MSTLYAGADTYPTDIAVLDDGDDASAAGIGAAAFEGLADRTTYLKARLTKFVSGYGFWSDDGSANPIATSVSPAAVYTKVSEVTMTGLVPADLLDIDADIHVAGTAGGDAIVALGTDVGGVYTIWDETIRFLEQSVYGVPVRTGTVALSGVTGSLKICLFVKADGADDVNASGPGMLRIRVLRA
jgi:hypothetical protein